MIKFNKYVNVPITGGYWVESDSLRHTGHLWKTNGEFLFHDWDNSFSLTAAELRVIADKLDELNGGATDGQEND